MSAMQQLYRWISACLITELLVRSGILFWPQLLLEKCEQNGDHQAGLQCLPKDDEEDGNGENVGHSDQPLRQASKR